MQHKILLLAAALTLSTAIFSQTNNKPSPAAKTEQKEVKEANKLRKSLELQQLNAAPEKISDSTSKRKIATSKRHCKKKPS